MKFSVYDVDDHKRVDDVSKHDVIGEIECCLADIVTVGQQYTRNLRHKGGCVKVGVFRLPLNTAPADVALGVYRSLSQRLWNDMHILFLCPVLVYCLVRCVSCTR